MSTHPQHTLVVEGLQKRFGDVVALDGVDFAVPAGTVLGLLGPNGAGKTTTVRVLTTTVRPDAGRVEVLGIDVLERPAAVRRRIGLAGQYAAVDDNLTGRENLRMISKLVRVPRAQIAARVDDLLERFALTDAADRVARTYSGGMRRRLDLAAALVHNPPVMLHPLAVTHLLLVIQRLYDDAARLRGLRRLDGELHLVTGQIYQQLLWRALSADALTINCQHRVTLGNIQSWQSQR